MSYHLVPLHERWDLADECCELLSTEWKRSYGTRLHYLKQSNDNLPCHLVMLHGDKLIGHVRISSIIGEAESLFLTSVIILPSQRGKGLGRKLLELTEEYAMKYSFKSICLTSDNKEAFYRKCGFKDSSPVQPCPAQSMQSKLLMLQNKITKDSTRNDVEDLSQRSGPPHNDESFKAFTIPPPPPPPPPVNHGITSNLVTTNLKTQSISRNWMRKDLTW